MLNINQHSPVIDENLLAGLYKVQAGDAPHQTEPRVVENVRLAIWFKTVTNLTNIASTKIISSPTEWSDPDLVSEGCAVALQVGHAVRQVDIIFFVQSHLVRRRLLPVPPRPDLHPVVEADDGAGLDVRPGKESLASILDPALSHLHKYCLVRVPGVRVGAEQGRGGEVLGEALAGLAEADQGGRDGGVDQSEEVLHLALPARHQLAVGEGPEEAGPAVRVEIELEHRHQQSD